MKLTDEQRMQYYAEQGIDRRDLLSERAIGLDELPPDARLDGPGRSMVEDVVREWNRFDPLTKLDAAGAMERRVLGRRTAVPAEAWCAFLLLGRVRGSDARREAMLRIARGELTPSDVRQLQSGRKPRTHRTDAQRSGAPVVLSSINARLRDAGATGVRRETTRVSADVPEVEQRNGRASRQGVGDITVHAVRAVRPGRSKR